MHYKSRKYKLYLKELSVSLYDATIVFNAISRSRVAQNLPKKELILFEA